MAPTPDVAPGQVSDGHALVLWVPTIANPKAPTVAELTASGVLDLTYKLFGDGLDHQSEVTKNTSTRYTLAQELEFEGSEKDTLVLRYPYRGTEDDVVRLALTRYTEGFLVERLNLPKDTAIAADQLLSIVAPVRCGKQREIPRTKNTEIGKIQDLLPIGTVETDVKVVAGP